MIIKKIMI